MPSTHKKSVSACCCHVFRKEESLVGSISARVFVSKLILLTLKISRPFHRTYTLHTCDTGRRADSALFWPAGVSRSRVAATAFVPRVECCRSVWRHGDRCAGIRDVPDCVLERARTRCCSPWSGRDADVDGPDDGYVAVCERPALEERVLIQLLCGFLSRILEHIEPTLVYFASQSSHLLKYCFTGFCFSHPRYLASALSLEDFLYHARNLELMICCVKIFRSCPFMLAACFCFSVFADVLRKS